MNIVTKTTELAHYLALPFTSKEAIACDLTTGNGFDTLFLCENCKFVYGFDIQERAIENTKKKLLENNFNNFQLIQDSHSEIDKYINQQVNVFFFNSGYLPSGDKSITTQSDTTLLALQKAINLLRKDGIIVLTIYYGEDNDPNERQNIIRYISSLDEKMYPIRYVTMPNQQKQPPEIVLISKK